MYIKSVTVKGFKTYKEETTIDLSPQSNLILGKNGSGKSNLLDAIQFVLSDKYNNLSSDERSKLLYEGAGGTAMQADVEIIFDNSDGRIPVRNKRTQNRTESKLGRTEKQHCAIEQVLSDHC
jgi:structural maintenance of chromosome 3 (chondroitin sulfate proteoglycan 6)